MTRLVGLVLILSSSSCAMLQHCFNTQEGKVCESKDVRNFQCQAVIPGVNRLWWEERVSSDIWQKRTSLSDCEPSQGQ